MALLSKGEKNKDIKRRRTEKKEDLKMIKRILDDASSKGEKIVTRRGSDS